MHQITSLPKACTLTCRRPRRRIEARRAGRPSSSSRRFSISNVQGFVSLDLERSSLRIADLGFICRLSASVREHPLASGQRSKNGVSRSHDRRHRLRCVQHAQRLDANRHADQGAVLPPRALRISEGQVNDQCDQHHSRASCTDVLGASHLRRLQSAQSRRPLDQA